MIIQPLPSDQWPDLAGVRAQAERARMIADGRLVVMTQAEVDALPEYSATDPSGVYVGKRWKRNCHRRCIAKRGPSGMADVDWLIGAYIKNPEYTGGWKMTPFGEVPEDEGHGRFPAHIPREGYRPSPILIQFSHVEISDGRSRQT